MKNKIVATLDGWNSRTLRPNNPDETWGIYSFIGEDNKPFQSKGVLSNNVRHTGIRMTLEGEWKQDRYGWAFVFTNHVVCHPAGKIGMVAFLKTAPHIGKVAAEKLWVKFGDQAAKTLARQPASIEKEGILQGNNLQEASNAISFVLNEAEYYMPLVSLFSNIGFPKTLPKQIIDQRWGDPVTKIKENPFVLINFHGVGFLKVDTLRSMLGLSPDLLLRLRAAVVHAIDQYTSHVWVSRKQVESAVRQLLTFDVGKVNQVVEDAISSKYVAAYTAGPTQYLAIRKHAEQEYSVSKQLISLMKSKSNWPPLLENTKISPHQIEKLMVAQKNGPVAFLLGSAGCGKTFTAVEVVASFLNRGDRVIVCAPTGKAALRIDQVLQNAGIKEIQPRTIHSTLEATMTRKGWCFSIDGVEHFIEADLVVIDELSMLGNDLGYALFKAIKPGTHILCIGDPNQLAPVSRGTLLRDWASWCKENPKFTYGLLEEVRRNSGEIVRICTEIYQGKLPKLKCNSNPGVFWDRQHNLQLKHCQNDQEIQDSLFQFYNNALEGKIIVDKDPDTGDGGRSAHPVKDIQIVVAVNENSPASRSEINKLFQKKLNPAMVGKHEIFKIYDKIICTSPSWIPDPFDRNAPKLLIANGSIGHVLESNKKTIIVRMYDYPTLDLLLPVGSGKGDFDLAYAITCHKMQGSEDRIMLTLLGNSYGINKIADRGWFYTAITRAIDLSIVFGTNQAVTRICKRNNMDSRTSFVHDWFTRELKCSQ